ncbi:hypothetical protein [Ilumatobacter nonamiensis]|uniref:hypothetical protein n=1 Tax=Ilumatobacter nonamiensis TaxID=467093 RepID=UPI00034CC216|nr:hypothetical protein [Ilumatobacter nonamiensis]
MNETDSSVGEPGDEPNLPDPVAEHELLFGRECTSGYLMEHGERDDALAEATAERVSSTPPGHHEQDKPGDSLRV